ncbi:hypothetical protein [Kitasatospora sp. NPDC088346]|uniref:hypothetical protein n=1 Tax=Kitasatospora sp. NPDC088346 TaxID=3364073 RepID=UPI00380BA644
MDEPQAHHRRISTDTTFVTDPEQDPDAASAFGCPRACCRADAPADPPADRPGHRPDPEPGYWGWRRPR